MARVRTFTAVLLIAVFFPATVELIENLVHYANNGHWSIFEANGHHHHTPESEGCCTGTCGSHLCGFNQTPMFHGGRHLPGLSRRDHDPHLLLVAEAGSLSDGFSNRLYRPPIA